MIQHIFSFEWKQLKNSGLFLISITILPLLIGYSLYLGSERVALQEQTMKTLRLAEENFYADKKQELEVIEAEGKEVERWFQDPANPLVLGQFGEAGRHVFLTPKPLAALAGGQLDILPYYGKVTLTGTLTLRDNALENPFMQVIGAFDFVFVLVWLVPLFVIALGYNMLSSERELGTFALLRSQPVSIVRILIFKMLFRFLITGGLVLISLIVWSVLFGIDLMHADGFALMGVVLLYITFWFILSTLFNLLPTESAVNAVSLAGLWVLFLLVIPSIISMLASSFHPVPSRALWTTEQRSIQQAVQSENSALFDAWMADHPGDFVEGDTPVFYEAWLKRLMAVQTIDSREKIAREKFEMPKKEQAGLVSRLRPLSPPMWLQSWMEQKSGTDAGRLSTLDDELHAFQQEWRDFFLPRFRRLEFLSSDEFELIPHPG